MIRLIALILLSSTPARADAIAERLMGYVEACPQAMIFGNLVAFGGLTLETELTTDTTLIRGWRGVEVPGLVVSLLVRTEDGRRQGICDVSFVPRAEEAGALEALAVAGPALIDRLRTRDGARVDGSPAGEVIMVCDGAQGLGYFLDTANLERGFNLKVSLAGPNKIQCGG